MDVLKTKVKDTYEDPANGWAKTSGNGPNKDEEYDQDHPWPHVQDLVCPNANFGQGQCAVVHMEDYMLLFAIDDFVVAEERMVASQRIWKQ